jgi:hypothetical protein
MSRVMALVDVTVHVGSHAPLFRVVHAARVGGLGKLPADGLKPVSLQSLRRIRGVMLFPIKLYPGTHFLVAAACRCVCARVLCAVTYADILVFCAFNLLRPLPARLRSLRQL